MTLTVVSKTGLTFGEKVQKLFQNIQDLSQWKETLQRIKSNLFKLALIYIRSERITMDSKEQREGVAFHLWTLSNLVEDLVPFSEADPEEQEKIFEQILKYSGIADYSSEIQCTLNDLALEYLRSEEVAGEDSRYREEIVQHFDILNTIIFDIERQSQVEKSFIL